MRTVFDVSIQTISAVAHFLLEFRGTQAVHPGNPAAKEAGPQLVQLVNLGSKWC